MSRFGVQVLGENVVEQAAANRLQQAVFGLEMGIKGAATDVRLVDDVLYGDIIIAVFHHQLFKRLHDRTVRLLYPPVRPHDIAPISFLHPPVTMDSSYAIIYYNESAKHTSTVMYFIEHNVL